MTARATEAAIRREAAALVAAGLRIVLVLVGGKGVAAPLILQGNRR